MKKKIKKLYLYIRELRKVLENLNNVDPVSSLMKNTVLSQITTSELKTSA